MTTENTKKVVFLLGSGVSSAPSVSDITEYVFDENNFNDIYKDPKGVLKSENEVFEYIKKLKSDFESVCSRYGPILNMNYEDLYYRLVQINNCLNGQCDFSIIRSYLKENNYFGFNATFDNNYEQLKNINIQIAKYIEDCVYKKLNNILDGAKMHNCLIDANEDDSISCVDIFTLNHDLFLEKLFESKGIDYNDEFNDDEFLKNGIKKWSFSSVKKRQPKVNLYKLHGSINWFWFAPINSQGRIPTGFVGKCLDGYENAQFEYQKEYRAFITGTTNKAMSYSAWFYSELQCRFNESLRNIDKLIVSGYGFGDSGINSKIMSWFGTSEKKMLITIYPNDDYWTHSKGKIKEYLQYPDYNENIKCEFEKASWQEIKDKLLNIRNQKP